MGWYSRYVVLELRANWGFARRYVVLELRANWGFARTRDVQSLVPQAPIGAALNSVKWLQKIVTPYSF